MKDKDHKLQQDFENGKVPSLESVDANAYRHIFRALKNEPELKLPDHFAQQVIQKLAQRNASLFKEYFWLGTGIFLTVIALIVAALMTGFKLDFGFLKGMSSYKGLFAFGIAAVIVWQFFEKRLLKIRPA